MNQSIREEVKRVIFMDGEFADEFAKSPLGKLNWQVEKILSTLHSTLKKRMEKEKKTIHLDITDLDSPQEQVEKMIFNDALSKAQQIIDEVLA